MNKKDINIKTLWASLVVFYGIQVIIDIVIHKFTHQVIQIVIVTLIGLTIDLSEKSNSNKAMIRVCSSSLSSMT